MVVETSNSSRVWKLATTLCAILAAVAIVLVHIESQRADAFDASVKAQQQQLRALQVRLAEAEKPTLPITLSFRPALLGSGLVGMFRNTSPTTLELAAVFMSPATGLQRQANLVIPPNSTKEIGHAEGWPFAAGQHVRLTNNRFLPADYDVPQ